MMFQKSLIALMAVVGATAFAPQSPAFVGRNVASTSLSMATAAELEEKVKGIIVSQLGVDAEKVVPSATFVDDLGADSLDTVELIMAIEEEFDCEIPEEEAANISTVQEVIDYVTKL
jgi:acyl carrier protein